REDVNAVAVVLDHPRDATHLALDPGQPLEELILVRRIPVDRLLGGCPVRRIQIPPGGVFRRRMRAARGELPVQGVASASSAARVERSLNKLDGVNASVNYATERAAVLYDSAQVTPQALVAAVVDAGYTARLPEASAEDETDPAAALRRRLVVSAVLSP